MGFTHNGLNTLDLRPSATQAATTHNYVSSIDLVNNLHKPEIDSQLTMSKGDQSLTGFMQMAGGMNGISSIEYSHYEEDWLHETIQVDAQAAGGFTPATTNGLPVTHTVAAGDTLTTNAPNSPYIDTATEDFILPRKQDLIQYPNGVKRAYNKQKLLDCIVEDPEHREPITRIICNSEFIHKISTSLGNFEVIPMYCKEVITMVNKDSLNDSNS